jgi:hypothetical protein
MRSPSTPGRRRPASRSETSSVSAFFYIYSPPCVLPSADNAEAGLCDSRSAVFVYPKDKDSVLLVEPGDYNACDTSSYDKKFQDGSTSFALDRSGAFFFISGVDANCRANEKLIVMVAATAPAPDKGSPAPPSKGDAGAQAPPNAPAAKNSTARAGSPPAAAGNDNNGAGLTVAAGGLVASVIVSCIAYATLAF